jgi:CRP-like cAMP-binding protein/predicted negative regulator of RcsB-dependent stress response
VPRPMHYNANSVVYFTGDMGDKIFILQSGKIILKSIDIETGEELTDLIRTGEFFGVKSALGHYPREEDAIVLADSECLMFTVPEFEVLVSKNTRIIMKMLKVFSNQLRRIHGKVRNLLAMGKREVPEEGLYKIAEYYLKKQAYPEAIYTLRKYLQHFPAGAYVNKAGNYLKTAEQYSQQYGRGRGPAIIAGTQASTNNPNLSFQEKPQLSEEEEEFYKAESFLGQQDYLKAAEILADIIKKGPGHGNFHSANIEMAKALLGLKKGDTCIKHLSTYIQAHSDNRKVPEALVYLGDAYAQRGERDQAMKVYQRALQVPSIDDINRRKANAAIRKLEGKA